MSHSEWVTFDNRKDHFRYLREKEASCWILPPTTTGNSFGYCVSSFSVESRDLTGEIESLFGSGPVP